MPSLVTISGTSRPDNYTSRALAVVDDELRNSGCEVNSAALRGLARSLVDYLRDYVCPKHTLEAQTRGQSTPWVASV